MTYKVLLILVFTALSLQACKSQQNQFATLRVSNNLGGDIDYAKGALTLTLTQPNRDESTVGKITKGGTILLELPEIDIKAIHDEINMYPTPLNMEIY